MYKILITASGTGSRLKDLTKSTNKSLVEIAGKKVIDYIIEAYDPAIELVVTTGYYGDKVKSYLKLTYPERKFIFVDIDLYEGPGSSLGYSMLQAKEQLQCPFIFHCNDTIVTAPIPSPDDNNWNGGSKGTDPAIFNTVSYSSLTAKNGYMQEMNPKGATHFDYFHIGLVGIKDYQAFWTNLENAYQKNPADGTLNDVISIKQMLKDGFKFITVDFPQWYDTGNLLSLKNAELNLSR